VGEEDAQRQVRGRLTSLKLFLRRLLGKERRFETAAALTKRRSLQAGVSPQARKIPFQLLKARPRPAGWVAGDFS